MAAVNNQEEGQALRHDIESLQLADAKNTFDAVHAGFAHRRSVSVRSEDRNERIWESCCFKLHRGILIFLCQFIFSLIILLFCVYQLTRTLDNDSRLFYSATTTLILGIWSPQPFPRPR